MTLTYDRPEARPFDGPQPVPDPQGHALKHIGAIAMRSAVARPVGATARAGWRPVQSL
jgi:hypothetical protein